MIDDKLRDWLRQGIEDGRFTQAELSNRTNIHSSQISRFLKGENCLSLDNFVKLTDFARLDLAPTAWIEGHMKLRRTIEEHLDSIYRELRPQGRADKPAGVRRRRRTAPDE